MPPDTTAAIDPHAAIAAKLRPLRVMLRLKVTYLESGYTYAELTPRVLADIARILAKCVCPACGCVGLSPITMIRGGKYDGIALCPVCGHAEKAN